MKKSLIAIIIISQVWASCTNKNASIGQTEITKWQDGKNAALSLTYDDGSMNQFRVAIPLMNKYSLPATFFIITGNIQGSEYHGKFIGRSGSAIIAETATIPTNKDNFFERASAIGYIGFAGMLADHKQAGTLYDGGKAEEAYKVIDEAYKRIREGKVKPGNTPNQWYAEGKDLTWDSVRQYAAQGHEFASHMVTHPRLAALDEVNMIYEMEKSREDILKQMGPKYIFSAECPFGTENERVMEYAHKYYPALRNRMPESWLTEINRASKDTPGNSNKEYVQWQRGAISKTPLPTMEAWVDTVVAHSNNWLVLVIHGVDGMGYEPIPHDILDKYYKYIKDKEDKVWVATFGDVTKYMRERMSAKVSSGEKDGRISVTLSHSLDKTTYDVPLTLKTYVSSEWKQVQVKQGDKMQVLDPLKDDKGTYVLYQASANAQPVELSSK